VIVGQGSLEAQHEPPKPFYIRATLLLLYSKLLGHNSFLHWAFLLWPIKEVLMTPFLLKLLVYSYTLKFEPDIILPTVETP
jgi:hypothetical protein